MGDPARDPWEIRLDAGPGSPIDEIVSLAPVSVHLERMSDRHVWLAMRDADGRRIDLDLWVCNGRLDVAVGNDQARVAPKFGFIAPPLPSTHVHHPSGCCAHVVTEKGGTTTYRWTSGQYATISRGRPQTTPTERFKEAFRAIAAPAQKEADRA